MHVVKHVEEVVISATIAEWRKVSDRFPQYRDKVENKKAIWPKGTPDDSSMILVFVVKIGCGNALLRQLQSALTN